MARFQVVLKSPNPLFEKWLKEWLDEADRRNLRSASKLRAALESLKMFPLPLKSGRECAVLRGFGSTLCSLIDQKVEEYKKLNRCDFDRSMNYDNEITALTNKIQNSLKKKMSPKKPSPSKLKKQKSKIESNLNIIEDELIMKPGSFKIILIIDTQETNGKYKTTLDETRSYMEKQKIDYEIRRLSVGDFAWICRDDQNNELILPYIIERKRMDDFANSIRDGRFHEQKFRLRNSGIENIIYLIENYGNNQHVGLPIPNLMQAAINTQLHCGFQIKFTDNHRESLLYLSILTRILIQKFKDKTLMSLNKQSLQSSALNLTSIDKLMKFNIFQDSCSKSKNLRVREIFLKQLLQLKSLSIDKALAITQIYPTPKSLLLEYQNCWDKDEAENLLALIPSGKLSRPVGKQISKIIYQFYNEGF